MGGVSGHAGLFATGADLARFAQVWLREGRDPSGQWVAAVTMRQFLTPSAAGGTRLLGWDSPDFSPGSRSQFGRLATPTTFGHTGWTGTFMWFDPVRDVFVVFLTNRSLGPTTRRSLEAMRRVRAHLSDAVARTVRGHCVAKTIVNC
jgi:CubicO group peptidase (beta-lactamase class C family)